MRGFLGRRAASRWLLLLAVVFVALSIVPVQAYAATPRLTDVAATPSDVSPNAAPRRVVVRYRLSASARVTVTVRTSSGAVVRRVLVNSVQQQGLRSATWDLRTSTGGVVNNGVYRIVVSVTDLAGRPGSPPSVTVPVRVDATPPNTSVTAVSPVTISSAVPQTATITYRLSDNIPDARLTAILEIVNWSGDVVDRRTQTDLEQGTGKTFEWGGRTSAGARVPAGAYWARIRVRDRAGNERTSTRTLASWLHVNRYSYDRLLDTGVHTHLIARSETRNGVTHVAYNDRTPAGNAIRYRSFDASGNTLIAPVIVAPTLLDTDYDRGVPDISVDASGAAWIVWRGPGPTTSRRAIWLARLSPNGQVEWAKRVLDESNSLYPIKDPRISVSPDGLAHVVCWRTGGPNSILYANFRADGNAVVGWTALVSGGGVAVQRKLPNVCADALGRVHVVWYDAIDRPLDQMVRRELYYTRLVWAGGLVRPPGSGATIDRKRLTTTEYGYSPSYFEAPELSAGPDGSLHVVWPDQRSAHGSEGIRYLKIAPSGSLSVASRKVADGSSTSTGPRYGHHPGVVATRSGGAVVVFQAMTGISGPQRIWQVDVNTSGQAGQPYLVSAGRERDELPSISGEPDGPVRLVFSADTGVPVGGVVRRRLTHKDLTADPTANDTGLGDLQVDSAHARWSSSPAPPRQNDQVTIQAEVRNTGWSPIVGGTATLEYEGLPVDQVTVPALASEATASLSLRWRVPDDATRTPALLSVRLAAPPGQSQVTTSNDRAVVSVPFRVPPTSAHLLVSVNDETFDEGRIGRYGVDTGTAALSGTTADGAPYSREGTRVGGWLEFVNVPLGTYTLTHSAPGHVTSEPTNRTVTIARDPSDRYKLVVTPPSPIDVWVNRWATINGVVHESGGTTPVAGVKVTILASGATSTTPSNGTYRLARLFAGHIDLKFTKSGWARTFVSRDLSPASTVNLDVPMSRTTEGYLVGAITDTGGEPLGGDPTTTADDPTITVKRGDGSVVRSVRLADGRFDLTLPAGSYKLDFSAPGYKAKRDILATVRAGEELDRTTELEIDVSGLTTKKAPERWCVPWTIHANWFGSQPPGSDIPSYNIKMWFGMFRFTFDGAYQRVGTSDYIRLVRTRIIGEAWDWHYIYGVTPPTAPKIFEYRQDLLGVYDDRFQPPMLHEGSRWNRTGVRVDGIDIVDQRDWSVVSKIRSQWNSCEEESHQYGTAGSISGDGTFPAYSHTVPWNQQVVRLWITIGRMDETTGAYRNATFADISSFNQGQLMQGSGYNQLMLYWRPVDNHLWVEPALVGYPQVGG